MESAHEKCLECQNRDREIEKRDMESKRLNGELINNLEKERKRDEEIFQLKREIEDLKETQHAYQLQYELYDLQNLQFQKSLNHKYTKTEIHSADIQAQNETISTLQKQISILQEQMAKIESSSFSRYNF